MWGQRGLGMGLMAVGCLAVCTLQASSAEAADAAMLQDLEAYVSAHPEDVDRRVRLARALQGAGKLSEALPHAEAALKTKPGDTGIALLTAQLYFASKQLDQAKLLLETVLTTTKDAEVIRGAARQLASIAAQQNQADAFLAQAEDELAQRPGDLAARWKVIEGYFVGRRGPAETIAKFTALLTQNPRDERLRARFAQTYARHGELEQGLRLLKEGLKLDPGSPELLEGMAEAYAHANRSQEAVTQYEALLAKSTDEGRNKFYRSRIEQLAKP